MTSKSEPPQRASPELLLAIVLARLPLHAEEDAKRDQLSEQQLVAALMNVGATEDAANTLVFTTRRQLEALAVLDPIALLNDAWAFVSYPASLLARAWITTLATPGQHLLPIDYWEQGDAKPLAEKEEQRALLHRIETGRTRFNTHATPIRVVHVAWGFIRIGGKFLLHRREDIARPGEKSHVLPGGRFKLCDLPLEIWNRATILAEVFDPDSAIVAEWITTTLARELNEELDLQPDKHYTCIPFGNPLPIYREVNGAGNRHAYTAYRFFLYKITLTTSGETHLLQRVTSSGDLAWLTAAEIAAPQRADGPSAYVDALRNAWGERLEQRLAEIPDSRVSPYAYDLKPGPKGKGQSDFIHLPAIATGTLRFGKLGHERAVDVELSDKERALLTLLGWHARGFSIRLEASRDIQLLPTGWIDISRELPAVAQSLVSKVAGSNGPIPGLLEIREGRFLGVRASPAVLFFDASLFRYAIDGSGEEREGVFRFERREVQTPWGLLVGDAFRRPIKRNIIRILRELEQGNDPEKDGINAGDWAANLRQQLLPDVNRLGMSTPWSTANSKPSLMAGLTLLEVDSD
ncbi:MAG: hypothetical protein AABZ19_09205 [Pseudomonadota bacterium]